MANLTIDSTLYITGVTGYLCTYDQFHQIVMRGDMCCTTVNRMAFYEYGDTLANCGGYRFHTGTTAQPLKFSVANDAAYFANNVGFGTLSPTNALHVYRDAGTSATLALQVGGNYGYFFGNGCCIGIASDYGTTGIKFHISRQAPDNAMLITSAGKVSVGSTSPNGQLTVAADQSSNNQHINIVGTQTSYSQEWGFGIPTSTKDLRIYDYTVGLERMRITSTGNVGINTSTPCVALHVSGIGLIRNGGTDTSGCRAGGLTVDIAGCAYAGVDLQDANRHMALTSNVDNRAVALTLRNLSRGRFWDIVNEGTGTDKLLFNTWCNTAAGYFNRVTIEGSTGNMGINTCTPGTYKLNVNGSFYSAGSSCEYKTQICNYNTDSCMFMKLKPVTYQYKDEYCHLGKELKSGTQIGLIAEEVAESHPELAILVNEEDEKVVRNVDYEKLTIILLSEVQKLRQEVDQLKNK